jgi:methylglyoxal synthase
MRKVSEPLLNVLISLGQFLKVMPRLIQGQSWSFEPRPAQSSTLHLLEEGGNSPLADLLTRWPERNRMEPHREGQISLLRSPLPTIALIAHDQNKPAMLAFARRHRDLLSAYRLIATGTTGKLIHEATGLEVERKLSGPLGGDAQIAAEVTTRQVMAVIFLIDPLTSKAHEPDIQSLLRICEVHNVPLATNLATAEVILEAMSQKRLLAAA